MSCCTAILFSSPMSVFKVSAFKPVTSGGEFLAPYKPMLALAPM